MGNHFNKGKNMKETLTDFANRKKREALKAANDLLRNADNVEDPNIINEILLNIYQKEEEARRWAEVA